MLALRLTLPRVLPKWRLVIAKFTMFAATFALTISAEGLLALGVLVTGMAIGAIIGLTKAKS